MKIHVEPDAVLEYYCSRDCGRCCRSGLAVFPGEAGRISKAIRKSVDQFATLEGRQFCFHTRLAPGEDNGRVVCTFLRPGEGCEIHPIKPLICRLYPFHISISLSDDLKASITPSASDVEKCRELGGRVEVAPDTFAELAGELLRHNAVEKAVEPSASRTEDEYAQRAFELFSTTGLEEAVVALRESGREECSL